MFVILLKSLASRTGLISLGVAVLAATLLLQTARLNHAKSDLAKARRDNLDAATGKSWRQEATATAKSASELGAALDQQSQALLLLQATQARATAASRHAVAVAQTLDVLDRQAARSILRAKVNGDPCSATNALILNNLASGVQQ